MKVYPIFSPEDADLAALAYRSCKSGYARRTVRLANGKPWTVLSHHEVCIRVFGRKPDCAAGEVTDHINRNRLDNRRENLRIVTHRQNALNRCRSAKHPHATRLRNGKFQAQVRIARSNYYLGLFNEGESATAAANLFLSMKGGAS